MREVKEIKISDIKPHPDNPRKDIGDISELTKSVKVNGIMQNLTVLPSGDGYRALIGHRRLAAAKAAGLETVPCVIVEDMPYQEQIALMLEENMQRNDLTVIEQAESFQLMLDLGASMDDLKETTGFSESTIRRRINLAKLDRETLKEAVENYQITISDLVELEKIDDIEERNRILADSRDHNQIVNKVHAAVREKELKKKADNIIFILEAKKIKEAPKGTSEWGNDAELLDDIHLDKDEKVKQSYKTKHGGELMYIKYLQPRDPRIKVIEKFKPKKVKSEPDPRAQREKEFKSEIKGMESFRRMTIETVIEKNLKPKSEDMFERLFRFLEKASASVGLNIGGRWMSGKKSWDLTGEEQKKWTEKFEELPMITRMLIHAEDSAAYYVTRLMDYHGHYIDDEKTREIVKEWYEILSEFGHTTNKIYDAILDGTSDYYTKD